MTYKQIKSRGESWVRDVYNNIVATNNLCSVTNICGSDLGIVERDKYEYLLTYSFPCQDLSNAGKGAGMEKSSGTRSGLLWEVERLLKELNGNLPQVLVMENVPQVLKAKGWSEWCSFLESLGYKSFCEILNGALY